MEMKKIHSGILLGIIILGKKLKKIIIRLSV